MRARPRAAGPAGAAAATLVVALLLAGCGRADRPGEPGGDASAPAAPSPGASPAGATPPAPTPGEDVPTADATAVPGLDELQRALDGADRLADEVEQDLAADGS